MSPISEPSFAGHFAGDPGDARSADHRGDGADAGRTGGPYWAPRKFRGQARLFKMEHRRTAVPQRGAGRRRAVQVGRTKERSRGQIWKFNGTVATVSGRRCRSYLRAAMECDGRMGRLRVCRQSVPAHDDPQCAIETSRSTSTRASRDEVDQPQRISVGRRHVASFGYGKRDDDSTSSSSPDKWAAEIATPPPIRPQGKLRHLERSVADWTYMGTCRQVGQGGVSSRTARTGE